MSKEITETGLPVELTFESFWKVYPRKQGDKTKAEKKFNELSEADKFNAIQGAIHHRDNDDQWKDKTAIPYPTTFLNQRRWLNDIVENRKNTVLNEENETGSNAKAVWKAMTQMYGETWLNKYGEKPLPVWHSQLDKMPKSRIARGLAAVKNSGSEFPPSLPKFLEYCKVAPGSTVFQAALPRPNGDEELAFNSFAKMQEIIAKAGAQRT